jgi:hypothetical protein
MCILSNHVGNKSNGRELAYKAEKPANIDYLQAFLRNWMVEPNGFEPMTPTMPLGCKTARNMVKNGWCLD